MEWVKGLSVWTSLDISQSNHYTSRALQRNLRVEVNPILSLSTRRDHVFGLGRIYSYSYHTRTYRPRRLPLGEFELKYIPGVGASRWFCKYCFKTLVLFTAISSMNFLARFCRRCLSVIIFGLVGKNGLGAHRCKTGGYSISPSLGWLILGLDFVTLRADKFVTRTLLVKFLQRLSGGDRFGPALLSSRIFSALYLWFTWNTWILSA